MNVCSGDETDPRAVLGQLSAQLSRMTPEVRKAAGYVLENPNDVGVSSIREIARAADVKPNTFVRLARSAGFDGYDDFRAPFREQLRRAQTPFPDRARWLQSQAQGGGLGGLYADMASSTIANIEQTFAGADADRLQAAADAIVAANHTYVLGVGINYSLARTFAYLSDMAVDNVRAIPREGSLAIDELSRAGPGDVLLAMTFKPYRSDVLEAVELARAQGLTLVGISDSPASPVVAGSPHGFVVGTDTPQFFTSTVAAAALLETLVAFVVADADPEVVANIERFHQRRLALGIYHED